MNTIVPFVFVSFLNTSFSVSDIMSVLTFLTVIIGGAFALYKWIKGHRAEQVKEIREIVDTIESDATLTKIFLMIEYDKYKYDKDFHGGEFEKPMDKLLSYYNYICYLKHEKMISFKEFALVEYKIKRVVGNCQVQDYLYNLHHWSNIVSARTPYCDLIEYGIKTGSIDKNKFYDVTYCRKPGSIYHHNLNF